MVWKRKQKQIRRNIYLDRNSFSMFISQQLYSQIFFFLQFSFATSSEIIDLVHHSIIFHENTPQYIYSKLFLPQLQSVSNLVILFSFHICVLPGTSKKIKLLENYFQFILASIECNSTGISSIMLTFLKCARPQNLLWCYHLPNARGKLS